MVCSCEASYRCFCSSRCFVFDGMSGKKFPFASIIMYARGFCGFALAGDPCFGVGSEYGISASSAFSGGTLFLKKRIDVVEDGEVGLIDILRGELESLPGIGGRISSRIGHPSRFEGMRNPKKVVCGGTGNVSSGIPS